MCYRCEQKNNNQTEDCNLNVSKLSAVTALGLGMIRIGIANVDESKAANTSRAIPPEPENVLTTDQALESLMQGNERYVSWKSKPLDSHDIQSALIGGQNPYAKMLDCSDSRASPEHCFDEAQGDLFVARGAGDYMTNDNIATIEYSVAILNTPLIMVHGHESCGAVNAAMDAVDHHKHFPGLSYYWPVQLLLLSER